MFPNNFLAVVFSVLLSFIRMLCINGLTTQTMWQIKQQLYNYDSYGSIQLTKFTVPALALRSTWLLSSYMSNGQCEKMNGFISIQYGGFPLVSPLNETYPPFFHLNRSHQVSFKFATDNSTLSYRLENPVAGDWYALSALDAVSTDRIEQKGIGMSCYFYLDIVHHVVLAEDVTVLATGTTTSGLVQYGAQAGLFRFMTEESTTKYTIKISSCSCNGTSCSTSDSCPIRVSSRSQAFPIPSRNDTHSVNCSTSSECLLEMEQPVADDWQYIMIECLQPGNVSFDLTVNLEGCNWATLIPMGTPSTREPQHSGSPVDVTTTENPVSEKEVSDGYVRVASLRPPEADGSDLSVLHFVTKKNPSIDERVTSSPRQSFSAEEHDTIKGAINPSCLRLTDFGRFSDAEKSFSVTYRRRYGAYPMMNVFQLTGKEVVVSAFRVEPFMDSGGTLKLEANLLVSYLNDTSQVLVIELCLAKLRIPVAKNGNLSCPHDSPLIKIYSETGKNNSAKVYIPYPESGVWYIAMAAHCYGSVDLNERVLEQCRIGPIVVNSTVSLSPCVDRECGLYGSCVEYLTGIIHLTACNCIYGYRGYGCTDDTNAKSDDFQLVYVLLLTLSNLFFIPAIVISIYRGFYTEATVYFFTMFMSSFYHACDGENIHKLCIMPLGVLSFCDFLAAMASFWVTIVTMARLPLHWTSFSYVVALLALAMGVAWDRHSLWTFLIPSLVALLIMTTVWISRCWTRRALYPSKRRWLFFIAPGIFLTIVGLVIFAGLETHDNYQYTHSAWHICMALCIVLLLPTRPLHPIAKDDSLLSICVKGQNDGEVIMISIPKEEWQPLQTDVPFMSPVSTSSVLANGDIPQKNTSLEVPKEEDQAPHADSRFVSPITVRSVSANGDDSPKGSNSKGSVDEDVRQDTSVL